MILITQLTFLRSVHTIRFRRIVWTHLKQAYNGWIQQFKNRMEIEFALFPSDKITEAD